MTAAMKYENGLVVFTLKNSILQFAFRKCKLAHEYPNFKIKNLHFTHRVDVFFVIQKQIIYLYRITWLVCLTQTLLLCDTKWIFKYSAVQFYSLMW
jgi:hypothetical protein